jgi:O-antigen ligase
MTIALTLICGIYAAESFYSLGLRTPSGNDSSEFGISRVNGPLFAASTGYWIVFPALSYAVQQWILSPTHRVYTLTSTVVLFVTLFALGSRGALVALLLFFILCLVVSKRWQRWRLGAFLVSMASLGAVLTFTVADSRRLEDMTDLERGVNHQTCLKLVLNRNAGENIFGSGYASYWPWYLVEAESREAPAGRLLGLSPTSYGYILFLHPHSVFLLLTVELGLIGFSYFLAFVWILVREFLHSIRQARLPIFACGIVSSCVALFVELVIFRNSRVSTLWWVYFFGWLALNRTSALYPNETESKQLPLKERAVERVIAAV